MFGSYRGKNEWRGIITWYQFFILMKKVLTYLLRNRKSTSASTKVRRVTKEEIHLHLTSQRGSNKRRTIIFRRLYSINVILRSGWSINVVEISPLSLSCSSMTECESFWWIHEQLWPWQVQIIFGLLTFPKPKPRLSFSMWNPLPIKMFFLAIQSWGQMAGLRRSSESQTSSGQVRESLEQVEYVKLLVLNNWKIV